MTPQSRKGFKLKKKTKEQVDAMRKFYIKNSLSSKWNRQEVERLAKSINLEYKSVNKWLWDKKNRQELANQEKQRNFVR